MVQMADYQEQRRPSCCEPVNEIVDNQPPRVVEARVVSGVSVVIVSCPLRRNARNIYLPLIHADEL